MRVVVACVLASMLIVPVSAAQGPPLDTQVNTIWNQYTNSPACCTTFGSTLKDDPRFAGSGNYGSTTVLPAGTSTSFALRYELAAEEFAYPILLDAAGTVDFVIHVGALTSTGGAAGVARVTVDTALLLGSTVVAAGSGQTVVDVSTADGFKQVKYSIAPSVTRLDPAEGPLAWTITITGAASGIYVSHTDANGNGWVTLPIIGVEGGPQLATRIFENLAVPSVSQTFANATTGYHQFNFTSDLTQGAAQWAWNATAGSVNATLLDANGTILFSGVLEGNGTDATAFANAAAGAWNLTLAYDGFVGTFTFSIEEEAEVGGEGDHGDGAHHEHGNETTEAVNDAGKKDAPLPILVPIAGLVAALARRRL